MLEYAMMPEEAFIFDNAVGPWWDNSAEQFLSNPLILQAMQALPKSLPSSQHYTISIPPATPVTPVATPPQQQLVLASPVVPSQTTTTTTTTTTKTTRQDYRNKYRSVVPKLEPLITSFQIDIPHTSRSAPASTMKNAPTPYGAVDPKSKESKDSKRRAEQNRAAQRAFRIRRKNYIHDLEEKAQEWERTQVTLAELTKENQRLWNQLRELESRLENLDKAGTPESSS